MAIGDLLPVASDAGKATAWWSASAEEDSFLSLWRGRRVGTSWKMMATGQGASITYGNVHWAYTAPRVADCLWRPGLSCTYSGDCVFALVSMCGGASVLLSGRDLRFSSF